ncbi:hypothetical protein [Poriferisphaera sp. WC338]|uniref:hypothetical protein n=1 Tax=Poriferisphaera sp. WC338 TaxID=3425129 RepID=UPI003D8147E1
MSKQTQAVPTSTKPKRHLLRFMFSMKPIYTIILLLFLSLASYMTYRMTRSEIAAGIYRTRLIKLDQQYTSLLEQYNTAITKTAVTELLVTPDTVSVIIRDDLGNIKTISTPFLPTEEIYVDYVLADSRILIRRIYNQYTAPERGLLITPHLAHIDWDALPETSHGKAIYRTLTPGRWTIAISGSGSLTLAPATTPPAPLLPSPNITDYVPIEESDRAVESITPTDIASYLSSN